MTRKEHMIKFESFCKEYSLDYDFSMLSETQYKSYETVKAYLIFKYMEDKQL